MILRSAEQASGRYVPIVLLCRALLRFVVHAAFS